jgi:hypothetical protein
MIGSHTIPVFYLQQFANASPRGKKHGLTWVYEKGERTPWRALTHYACICKNSMHDKEDFA